MSGPATAIRPLVGLSTYRERAAWGVWDQPADLLPTAYADVVEACGGVPVLLPPTDPAGAAAVVARLDALVITGGADVDPGRYHQEAHGETTAWRPDRDAWELALLDAAAERPGLPVLGICRGLQVMAVHAGGTLEQHVPDRVGHHQHSPGGDVFGQVEVRTRAGSRLAGLVGSRRAVSCHHHQAVATHPGLEVAAVAADGTVEALEAPGEAFRVGVQWHPETVADVGLVEGLVRAATSYAGAGYSRA